jgi:hypothetical protein
MNADVNVDFLAFDRYLLDFLQKLEFYFFNAKNAKGAKYYMDFGERGIEFGSTLDNINR